MLRFVRLIWQRLPAVCISILPCLLLMSAPFFVFWTLWTPNALNRAFIYQDTTLIKYPSLVFLFDSIRQYAEIPLWSWGIYSGIPFHACIHNHFSYPLNLVFYAGILDVASPAIYNLYMLFHLGMAGVLFFVLARSFHFSKTAGFLGALTYTLSGFTTLLICDGTSSYIPHAWFPITMFFVRKFILDHKPVWILLAGISFALIISSLMPLSIIPILYFLIIFYAWSIVAEKKPDMVFMLSKWGIISIMLAFSLIALQLLPILEMSLTCVRQSTSEYFHARDFWSDRNVFIYVKEYFLAGDHAWGYLGCIGGLFALIGIWSRSGKYYVFWMSTFLITIIAFLVSKDFVLYDLFYLFVPMINKLNALYRGIGSIYVLAGAFLIMTGIAWGMKLLRRSRRPAKYSKGLPLAVAIVAWFLWCVYKPEDPKELVQFKLIYVRWLALVSMVVFVLSTIRSRKYVLFGSIVILCIFGIDTMSYVQTGFEHRLLCSKDFGADNLLVQYKSPYLVGRASTGKLPSINQTRINVFRNNSALIQGQDNTGGYYPFHSHRATQALSASGNKDHYVFMGPQPGIDSAIDWPAVTVEKLYDLNGEGKGRAWVVPLLNQGSCSPLKEMSRKEFDPYAEVYLEKEEDVIREEFGRSYAGIFKIIDRIFTPESRRPCVIRDNGFRLNDGLTLLRQTPNSATFRLEKDVSGGVIFFSDNWYPGWVVYVNGKRVPLYVANYTFKGIKIEGAKSSIIEFVFDPPITKIGYLVSIMAVLVMITLLCLPRVYRPIVRRV